MTREEVPADRARVMELLASVGDNVVVSDDSHISVPTTLEADRPDGTLQAAGVELHPTSIF